MVYGIYLTLDTPIWFRGDFSTENKLTGTIFTDKNLSIAKNLTGFTVTVRMFKPRTIGDRFNQEADIVVAANGTWSYAVKDGELPIFGLYNIKIELTKSGVKESTLNNVEIQILEGPSG